MKKIQKKINVTIKHEINSKQKEHSCSAIEKTEIVNADDIKTKEEEKQIVTLLIQANLKLNIQEQKKEIKDKLNDMCQIYYSKSKDNIICDINIDKIPKNRKNDSYINNYALFLDENLKKRRYFQKKIVRKKK